MSRSTLFNRRGAVAEHYGWATTLASSFGEQGCGEIAFAEIGQDDDHEFTGIHRAGGHLDGPDGGRAAGDPAKHSFFAGQPPSHFEGILIADRDDLVDDGRVQDVRDETRTESLDLVRAGAEGFVARIWLMTGESTARRRSSGSWACGS